MVSPHTHQVRIYILKILMLEVFHSNYFRFAERARTEWIRNSVYGKNFIATYRLMFVVSTIQSAFQDSSVLDDLITIQTSMRRLAKTYIDLEQNIIRGDNDMLVETQVRIVLVDCDKRRPTRIPENLYNSLFKAGNL